MFDEDKNYRKNRDHCHFTGKSRDVAHSICNLRFNVPNKTPVVFQNWPNYNYRLLIKELANKVKDKFHFLGENSEKYKPFSVQLEKRSYKS